MKTICLLPLEKLHCAHSTRQVFNVEHEVRGEECCPYFQERRDLWNYALLVKVDGISIWLQQRGACNTIYSKYENNELHLGLHVLQVIGIQLTAGNESWDWHVLCWGILSHLFISRFWLSHDMCLPVRQNPIQKPVKLSKKLCNYIILHNTT